MSNLDTYESQKVASLNLIAQTLQRILQEMQAIRAAQQQIAQKTH